MRKLFSAVLAMAVMIFMTGLSTAAAQGKSGGKVGKGGASSGRPATTGIEHAESTANPHGASHGIENAESKQAAHKGTDKDADKDKDDKTKPKHKKGKGKKKKS